MRKYVSVSIEAKGKGYKLCSKACDHINYDEGMCFLFTPKGGYATVLDVDDKNRPLRCRKCLKMEV